MSVEIQIFSLTFHCFGNTLLLQPWRMQGKGIYRRVHMSLAVQGCGSPP